MSNFDDSDDPLLDYKEPIPTKRIRRTQFMYKEHENKVSDVNVERNKIFEALTKILENQAHMQKQIDDMEEKLKEFPAMESMVKKTFVLSKQTYKLTSQCFGQNLSPAEEEMCSLLPLKQISDFHSLQDLLELKDNENAMRTYIASRKGNQRLNEILRICIEDDLLSIFNWEGRAGREALNQHKLFSKILHSVFIELDRKSFESQMRKAIDMSHNRHKQRVRLNKSVNSSAL